MQKSNEFLYSKGGVIELINYDPINPKMLIATDNCLDAAKTHTTQPDAFILSSATRPTLDNVTHGLSNNANKLDFDDDGNDFLFPFTTSRTSLIFEWLS